jgi:peptidoglycan L-alanyl-D-glutamate endopeptidase CwlK
MADVYAGLDKEFVQRLAKMKSLLTIQNIHIKCTCGYRSYAEQNALYAKGRTKQGPKVTNARGGYSWHNFRLAADFVFLKNGGITYDGPWEKFGAAAKECGLEWGGSWKKFPDRPHVQWTRGKTLAQMRAAVKSK